MDSINLKKLAKELNLAVSTVSRALRDSHEISQETKNRVKALAQKLGFQPNPHASSLRQNKSRTIAVVIPEIENNFFSQVINGAEEIAQQKGYHVLIYLTHEDQEREKSILALLRSGRVDGLMISVSGTTAEHEDFIAYRKSGIPLVFFDRIIDGIDVPKISTDDFDAAFRATELLIKRGAKHIALLSLSPQLSISNKRREGYEKALQNNGLMKQAMVIECGQDDEVNRKLIRQLMHRKNRPDAVFAAVEKLAINTYQVCQEENIDIPGDIKVIGFSNLSAASLFKPSMSTIVQPAYEIGREATRILFKIIENKILLPAEKKLILPSTILERESTVG